MKEIITVQVGQCGNQIGWRFWDCVQAEHAAYGDSEAATTFFSRKRNDERRARALLVDMEEGVVSQLMRSSLGHLFQDNLTITDVSGCGNNWAVGYASYGPEYGPDIMDRIRRLLEDCESPQSISLIHSVGGGTGSGLGSWILSHLTDNYPELYRICTSVLPAAIDDVVTSPYNAVLSLAQLREHADCVFACENDALLQHPIVKDYQDSLRSRPVVRAGGAGTESEGQAPAHPVLDIIHQAEEALHMAQATLSAPTAGGSKTTSVKRKGQEPVKASVSTRSSVNAGSATARLTAKTSGATVGQASAGTAGKGTATATSHVSASPSTSLGPLAGPSLSACAPKGSAFDGANEVVARMLADMTASVRFPGSMNVDLNEIATTLVPFPKMQFLTTGMATSPLRRAAATAPSARSPHELIEGLVAGTFDKKAGLITADLARERHIALACLLRGTDSISAFNDTLGKLRKDLKMVPWNEYGFKSGLCGVPPPWAKATALTISNNVCVRVPLARSYGRFLRLYRARAHLHHYLEYMDAQEIVHSAHTVLGGIQAYDEMAAVS